MGISERIIDLADIEDNEQLFEYAKQVSGEEKLDAIKRLEPATHEIRDWILLKGADESEDDEQAFLRFMKSGATERLKKKTTGKELSAIGHILAILYDFGEYYIEIMPNGTEVVLDFLTRVEEKERDVEVYNAVLFISDSSSADPQLKEIAKRIFLSDACKIAVRKAVKRGKGILLAKALNIPYQEQLLKLMKQNFHAYYRWANTLMKPDEGYEDQVLAIYRKELPPERIEQDSSGAAWNEYEEKQKALPMIFLLQNIGYYPGKGIDYVKKAVRASSLCCREHAVRVMAAWVTKKHEPLENCYPNLYKLLKEAVLTEKSSELKKLMQRLLAGDSEFFEDEVVDDEYDAESDEVNNYWNNHGITIEN